MGQKYLFRCFDCGYQTECSKGEDRGFKYSVKPYVCLTCKIVENCKTGESEVSGSLISKKIDPYCNVCHTSENLMEWDLSTCPKCSRKDMYYHYLPIPWD